MFLVRFCFSGMYVQTAFPDGLKIVFYIKRGENLTVNVSTLNLGFLLNDACGIRGFLHVFSLSQLSCR